MDAGTRNARFRRSTWKTDGSSGSIAMLAGCGSWRSLRLLGRPLSSTVRPQTCVFYSCLRSLVERRWWSTGRSSPLGGDLEKTRPKDWRRRLAADVDRQLTIEGPSRLQSATDRVLPGGRSARLPEGQEAGAGQAAELYGPAISLSGRSRLCPAVSVSHSRRTTGDRASVVYYTVIRDRWASFRRSGCATPPFCCHHCCCCCCCRATEHRRVAQRESQHGFLSSPIR